MIKAMKSNPKTSSEYENFENVLRQVIQVPHSEIKAKLEAEKSAKNKRPTPLGFRSLSPLPKICCPVCNMDIDVSRAKYSEPLSICHGQVTVYPQPGTIVGTLDFCISQLESES